MENYTYIPINTQIKINGFDNDYIAEAKNIKTNQNMSLFDTIQDIITRIQEINNNQ